MAVKGHARTLVIRKAYYLFIQIVKDQPIYHVTTKHSTQVTFPKFQKSEIVNSKACLASWIGVVMAFQ